MQCYSVQPITVIFFPALVLVKYGREIKTQIGAGRVGIVVEKASYIFLPIRIWIWMASRIFYNFEVIWNKSRLIPTLPDC